MSSTVSLKSILGPAKGKDRLPVLLKLCDLPSFWGEADEFVFLEEAESIAKEAGTTDEVNRTLFLTGKYYLRKADYYKAEDCFTKAMGYYSSKLNIRGQVDCLAQLAIVDSARSQFDKSLEHSKNATEQAIQIKYSKGQAQALQVEAMAQKDLGNLQHAHQLVRKAIELYESLQDIRGMAASYHTLGAINDAMGDYATAIENLDFALAMRENTGDRFGTVETLNEIGIVHWKQSNHLEGSKQLFNSLKIAEEIGDKFGLAIAYNVIGNINSNLGNFDDAIQYYDRAQQLCIELGRKKGIANANYNIGIVHYEQGRYETALEFHLRSLQINSEIGHKEGICGSLNYTGKVYAALGNYEEALQYQLNALKTGNELGDKRRIGIAHTGIGATYFHLGNDMEAQVHLTEALSIGRELNEKTIIKDSLFTMVELFKRQNNFKEALACYEQYYQVQNKISNESIQKQLTTLNFQHSLEVKEKESAILKEKTEEIQRYLHKLEISNNELKQFAHVAAHDLREPLRMISSYIFLLNQSLGTGLSDHQKKFMDFVMDGSKRMEQLIEDMLRLAKVDANPKIEKLELKSVVKEINLNLEALIKDKNALIIAGDLPPIMADRTQVLQLFQNIIGNGIKYNESAQPTINIKHEFSSNGLKILITDNGIGIPEHYREKAFQIFQRVPTAKQYSGSGIGLAICKKIVDSMNGKIWIEDNPAGGTCFGILLTEIAA